MPEELIEVRLEITRLVGEVQNIRTIVEAGDKQSEQLVELLKPRLNAQDKSIERLEGQFLHHKSEEHAPHDSTLGARVGKLENSAAWLKGALAVLGIASPVATALLTKQFGG
jgi:hypothetical protein